MYSNNVGHLITKTKTITTLQHFATLHHTSLHLSTLHFLSFTLHCPLIWLNKLKFPIVLFHLLFIYFSLILSTLHFGVRTFQCYCAEASGHVRSTVVQTKRYSNVSELEERSRARRMGDTSHVALSTRSTCECFIVDVKCILSCCCWRRGRDLIKTFHYDSLKQVSMN